MFNLGLSEIIVIAIVLIIVVGPERLPTVMKKVGNALRTVRQASREIQSTVGLDELWREDVMQPPRPRIPPSAAVSRQAELGPSAAAAVSAGDVAAPVGAGAEPAAGASPSASPATGAATTPPMPTPTRTITTPTITRPSTPTPTPAPAPEQSVAAAQSAPTATPADPPAPASGDLKGES